MIFWWFLLIYYWKNDHFLIHYWKNDHFSLILSVAKMGFPIGKMTISWFLVFSKMNKHVELSRKSIGSGIFWWFILILYCKNDNFLIHYWKNGHFSLILRAENKVSGTTWIESPVQSAESLMQNAESPVQRGESPVQSAESLVRSARVASAEC